MDTYFETATTDDTLSGCCCESSSVTDTWTEPAPDVLDDVYGPEPIWDPEVVTYEAPQPLYQPPADVTFEPQVAAVAEAPVVSDLSTTMTIGGDPYGDFTIVNPDGSPAADLGLSTMTIGGAPPIGPSGVDTMADSLATIYGVAAENGDIMSQLMVRDIMASQNAAIRTWTLPSGLYVY